MMLLFNALAVFLSMKDWEELGQSAGCLSFEVRGMMDAVEMLFEMR
ncbi:MAG: hypothetical protein QM703_17845 [Gemmatales bacterium]